MWNQAQAQIKLKIFDAFLPRLKCRMFIRGLKLIDATE